MIIVRYADDAVLGFERKEEAERFLEQLRERLAKFGLELHPDKTRLIEFGRYAAERRKKRGEGKPETYNFLGFTHYCGVSHKTGYFTVHRKTIVKRMTAKLKISRRSCANGCTRVLRIRWSGFSKWCAVISSSMRFQVTRRAYTLSAARFCASGIARFGAVASAAA